MKRYETYKDSGIEWLGEIPGHWEVKKLKYLTSCNDDVLSENTPEDTEIKYVEIGDVDSVTGINGYTLYKFKEAPSRARRITKVGDIIISTVRTYLKAIASVKESDLIVSTGFAVLRPQKIASRFLAYAVLCKGFIDDVIAYSTGVSFPAINASDLVQLRISVPPLSEQETIAAYLDYKIGQIDLLIAEKEKQMKDLQQYRMSLLSETVTRGLTPDVKMKESGVEWLGMIPEHWTTTKIKNLLEQSGNALRVGPFGSSLSGNDFVDEGYWVYNQRVVLDNNFIENDTFINETKYNELVGFRVMEGDILLTTRGSIGKIAIVPHDFHEGVIHPCIIRFRIDENKINKDFLQSLFNDTDLIANQVKNRSNSTTIDVIYSNTLKELQIALPPIKEQNEIVEYLTIKRSSIDTTLQTLTSQLSDLRRYKTSVITEAVTGKVDVRQWKQT